MDAMRINPRDLPWKSIGDNVTVSCDLAAQLYDELVFISPKWWTNDTHKWAMPNGKPTKHCFIGLYTHKLADPGPSLTGMGNRYPKLMKALREVADLWDDREFCYNSIEIIRDGTHTKHVETEQLPMALKVVISQALIGGQMMYINGEGEERTLDLWRQLTLVDQSKPHWTRLWNVGGQALPDHKFQRDDAFGVLILP